MRSLPLFFLPLLMIIPLVAYADFPEPEFVFPDQTYNYTNTVVYNHIIGDYIPVEIQFPTTIDKCGTHELKPGNVRWGCAQALHTHGWAQIVPKGAFTESVIYCTDTWTHEILHTMGYSHDQMAEMMCK